MSPPVSPPMSPPAIVDIALTKTESIDPVVAGSGMGNLTYTITAVNNGPSDASGVEVIETLTLPAGVTIHSIAPSHTTTYALTSASSGTWTIANLAAGASKTLSVTLTAGSTAAAGSNVISDTATLIASTPADANAANNTVTVSTSVTADTDGVPDAVEAACGDVDGDGIPDSSQSTVGAQPNAAGVCSAVVVPPGVTLSASTTVPAATAFSNFAALTAEGVTFPSGAFSFTLTGVTTSKVTVTVYPGVSGLSAYYKTTSASPTVAELFAPAVFDGNKVTLTLTDNGPFDKDPAVGTVSDPGAPAIPPPTPPPAPPSADTTGLFDPTSGLWYLLDSKGTVTQFFFGNPGDYPFVGDWDGNGTETPGLYRQSDGFAYLRNSNSVGPADITFYIGNPGDIPLSGDFDGDGKDTVSVYRPSNQTFYVVNKLGSGTAGLRADTHIVFGNPGDKPFVGDFNGDGVDTFGLHRDTSSGAGTVYYRNTLSTGNADVTFVYGNPADKIVSGDWNGSATDTPGMFRAADVGTMYLRNANSTGNADITFTFGLPTWWPVSGKFGLG